MRLHPQDARVLLSGVDPGQIHAGQAVGLRDGALLALAAAGLTAGEITALQASHITMAEGQLQIAIDRHGITWLGILPTDLGAWLLAWLTEIRLWADAERVFRSPRGPLTSRAIYQILDRHRKRLPSRCRRGG